MLIRIRVIIDFINNTGLRYLLFRVFYLIKIRSGYLKKQFPADPLVKIFIAKSEWLDLDIPFFIPNSIDL